MNNLWEMLLGGVGGSVATGAEQQRMSQARQATAEQAAAKRQYEATAEEDNIIEGEIVREQPKLLEDKSS